ncbi:MAG: DUF3142 domain-containing protein [Acidobacteriota bacterium]|nr:DUF3142 domain-containing protein [Blastocatellia bacterium]MDW8413374.1 DUF3142 domain-containing protein [Acidobacteriota bacterium]
MKVIYRISLAIVFLISCTKPQEPRDLQLGFWYWNNIVNIHQDDLSLLQQMKCSEVYAHAGQFAYGENPVLIKTVKEWKVPEAIKVHLVYNFTPQMIRLFPSIETESLVRHMANSITKQIQEIEQAGVNVVGVQFDFDVPTRTLDKYRQFLQDIRSHLHCSISITTLGDWIDSPNYEALVTEVDFHVPQLYGFTVPKKISQLRPISDRDSIKRYLEKLSRLDTPYFVGLHTYGYCLVFDENGNLVSLRTDLSPSELVRSPELVLLRELQQKTTIFQAISDTYLGKISIKRGWYIVVEQPDAKLLVQSLELVRGFLGRNLKGVLFFRYPQPNEDLVLSLEEILEALSGKVSQPQLKIEYSGEKTIYLKLHNSSKAAGLLAKGSIEVELQVKGLLKVSNLDFDEAACFFDELPSTPQRANRLVLRASYIGREQTLSASLEFAPGGKIISTTTRSK